MSFTIPIHKNATPRLEALAIAILIAIPVLSFLLNIVSWMRYGIDLPYMDDVRQYFNNSAGRLDLTYLFTPANDTLYPIGLALDSLAFRFLDGNSVAYQTITLSIVLGGLLIVQYDLLRRCTRSPLLCAACFSLTIFMLQPGSYWGLQNMAYHQAIPLLCILIAVDLVIARAKYAAPGLLLLGTISGLTYTSGAFAFLGLALALLALHFFRRENQLLIYGLAALIPGVLTSLAQGWVIVFFQRGTHRPDSPMAYPWELDFWEYMLGKVGRAAFLPEQFPHFSFLLAIAISILLVGGFVYSALSQRINHSRTNLCYALIFSSIFVYLLLICAGRTNMRPDTISAPIDVFLSGFARFHFFWITILFPWILAISLSRFPRIAAGLSLIGVGFLVSCSGITNYNADYQSSMNTRLENLECLRNGLITGDAFQCDNLHPVIDMRQVFFTSSAAGASFTRLITIHPIPIGTPGAIFSSNHDPYELQNFGEKAGIIDVTTSLDPMIWIRTGKPEVMSKCHLLEVNAVITTTVPEIAQLFYAPVGSGISEQNSDHKRLVAGSNTISFQVKSSVGFSDSLRLDPVSGGQHISVGPIEVRCRY